MQEVYRNGSSGEIEDFNFEDLQKSLENKNVDHVKVFNRETDGKIEIEINDLTAMIIEAVDTAFKKNEIMNQYNKLK